MMIGKIEKLELSCKDKEAERRDAVDVKLAQEKSHITKANDDKHAAEVALAIAESLKACDEKKKAATPKAAEPKAAEPKAAESKAAAPKAAVDQKKDLEIVPITLQAPDTEGIPAMQYPDGSCCTLENISPTVPKSITEISMFSGMRFLIALFTENSEHFADRNIFSPYALLQLLAGCSVDFESDYLLDANDFEKIGKFLEVGIAVNSTNNGGKSKSEPKIFGSGSKRLNPVTLDCTNGPYSCHYVVNFPAGVRRVVEIGF